MTRKDYTAIARAINEATIVSEDGKHIDEPSTVSLSGLINKLSAVMVRDNPNFDVERFHEACYAD